MNFLSTYEYICQFMKSKQNKIKHICKYKNSENKFKTREENLLATSDVGSGENFGFGLRHSAGHRTKISRKTNNPIPSTTT